MSFLTKAGEGLSKEVEEDQEIAKAIQVLEHTTLTDEEYEIYRAHEAWLRMEASALESVRVESLEKGREEGEAIGLEKGREEGEARGLEKGELNAKRNMARSLKEMNIPLSQIAQATGLSIQEIEGC